MAGRTKLFAAFLAAVFTLSAACASPAGPEDPVLTLMIYMTGSDLESGNGAATIDIMEMLGTGTDPSKVNVILCTGGTKRWQGSIPNGGICFWQVSGSDLHRLESLEQASMGNPGTLSMFLDYAANRFPARKYALILWNHGAGPMNGVCFDELFTENKMKDGLSLNELRRALADSPFSPEFPLEWIGFDACLMASVETAQTCAPYARYMIASQETEPWHGWNYRFLGGLSGDMTGEDAGKLISESYCGSGTEERGKLTLSCIRLDEMPAVAAAMEQLFSDLGTGLDAGSFPVIARGRRRAKSFGRGSTGSEYDLADLYSLAGEFEGIAPERAAALQEAVDRAVVLSEGSGEDCHGLSVYFPYFNKERYASDWKQTYGTWDFAEKYRAFMRAYDEIWLGDPLADWNGLQLEALPRQAESQEFTLQLTPEQAANFASAELVILQDAPKFGPDYLKVSEVDDVTLDENGVLHAVYRWEGLYAVDGEGNLLSDSPLFYKVIDGVIFIRANLADKTCNQYYSEQIDWIFSDKEDKEEPLIYIHKVYLQCEADGETGELEITGIIDLGEGPDSMLVQGEALNMGKQTLSMDDERFLWVEFLGFPARLTFDAQGNTEPFTRWRDPRADNVYVTSYTDVDNTKPWKLKFCEVPDTGVDLLAQMIVHDVQENMAGSSLAEMEKTVRDPDGTD